MAKVDTYYPVVDNDPNDFITIRNSDELIRPNFKMSELYNSKVGQQEHPLSEQVIDAVQAIRDYTDMPIRITSTYRNYIPTDGVSPASISPHMMAQAIDFQFVGDAQEVENLYLQIRDDFDDKGELFQILWNIGVRGFGSYDTFIHIDTVQSELYEPFRAKRTTSYNGQLYARWNKMKVLRNMSADDLLSGNVLVNAYNTLSGVIEGTVEELNNAEDRGKDFDWRSMSIIAAFIIAILSLISFPFFLNKRKSV